MMRLLNALVFTFVLGLGNSAFGQPDVIFRMSGELEVLPPAAVPSPDVNGYDGATFEMVAVFAGGSTAFEFPAIGGVAVFEATSATITITGAAPGSNGVFATTEPLVFRPIFGDFGRPFGNVTFAPMFFAGTDFAIRAAGGFEDPLRRFGNVLNPVVPSTPGDVIDVDRFGPANPAPLIFSDFVDNFNPALQSDYAVNNLVVSATFDTMPIEFSPTTVNVVTGTLNSGGAAELALSDNSDFSVSRNPMQFQPLITVEAQGVSSIELPGAISLTVEGSVFARGMIAQGVDMFDYNLGVFEEVDTRNASRLSDATIVITPGGDLSRFVEPGTGAVEARIRFSSAVQRANFTANMDQILWNIE